MKRFLCILIAVLLAFGLASCSSLKGGVWSADNRQTAEDRFQQIMKAIEEKDTEGLKNMFSPNALEEAEDIDGGIAYLMDFFKGTIWTTDLTYQVNNSTRDGEKTSTIRCMTIVSAKGSYLVFFIDIVKDTKDPDNVGLYMLQIIKESQRDDEFDWGKGESYCAGVYRPDMGEQEDET